MPQPIRLIIWDFPPDQWDKPLRDVDGVCTPLSLIRPLAHRGIVSAVCSQHAAAIRTRLESGGVELGGVASLMLFHDEVAAAKGHTQGERIAGLLRALRLSPGNALLISVSPDALREALNDRPGMQFIDDDEVGRLLAKGQLEGRADPDLQRLTQFRLLLRRDAEELRDPSAAFAPNAPAFLRGCDMHVRFDYDVAGQVDLALDLIRDAPVFSLPAHKLPDDPEQARTALLQVINQPTSVAGLVRLRDRFLDWGVVGLYVINQRNLRQFAFSPQAAGLGVDDWVYDAIGRPPLRASKDVEAHITRERADVDWITVDDSLRTDEAAQPAPWIPVVRARGAWDAEAVAHYLRPIAGETLVEPSVARETTLQVRTDHSSLLRLALESPSSEAIASVVRLGFRAEDFSTRLFEPAPPGSAIVLSVAADAEVFLYQHVTLHFALPVGMLRMPGKDLVALDLNILPQEKRKRAGPALEHLRANFGSRGLISAEETEANLACIFDRVPQGCTLFVLLANDQRIRQGRAPVVRAPQRQLNESIRRAASGHEAVVLIDPSELAPETEFAGKRGACIRCGLVSRGGDAHRAQAGAGASAHAGRGSAIARDDGKRCCGCHGTAASNAAGRTSSGASPATLVSGQAVRAPKVLSWSGLYQQRSDRPYTLPPRHGRT